MADTVNGRMEVLRPVERALSHARYMMFTTGSFGKWLSLGVIIFLEVLGSGGGSGGSGNYGNFSRGIDGQDVLQNLNQGLDWIVSNLPIILLIGAIILLFIIGFVVLITWLSSRGTMMLIRAVALNDADIARNWRATGFTANSLLRFKLVLFAVSTVWSWALIAIAAFMTVPLIRSEVDSLGPYLMAILPIFLVLVLTGIIFAIIAALLRNFVAPIMYRFDMPCMPAWRRFGHVARGNYLAITGALLLKLLFHFMAGIVTLFICMFTCCLGMLPVIGQAIMSPYYVFDRAFTLYVLESAGPEYATIAIPQEVESPLPPTPDVHQDV